jgi:small subunit ribosomal protein S7
VLLNDPVYNSRLVTRLINRVMIDGKKSVARTQVYKALEEIRKQTGQEPVEVLEKAIRNVGPKLEVRSRRIGGASYQVPTEVRGDRREALAIRWMIIAATARSNGQYHSFGEKLAAEILDAANNAGGAINKRDNVLKMAEANRAFAHLKW